MTPHQNRSSKYQIQISRTGDINNVQNFACEHEYGCYSDCLSNMYGYFEPRTTRHPGLVVSVSDFGTRGPGLIARWALITNRFSPSCFSLVLNHYFTQVISD